MKLGTQPVNTHDHTAFASGSPAVLPTNSNSPFAKLIVKSDLGHVVQQWLLLQNKCTLGSASSCALRCQLPGIAPYHALLVMGARQFFIRALSPKLTRNGVAVNELLLTEDECTFEIAGHRFELIRSVKSNEPAPSDKATLNRMKFALARPMEIGQTRQPIAIPTQTPAQTSTPIPKQIIESPQPPKQRQSFEEPQPQSLIESQRLADPSSSLQPQWITDLIQSAMLPLERQLSEIIEPLAVVQQELDKRSKLDRKRRRATKRTTTEPTALERVFPEQAALERAASERSAVKSAFTTQIDVQAQMAHIPEPIIVPIISPEVESQLARQSETLDNLNERLTEVKSNLGSLERVVSENFVSVISAATAPVPTPEPVNEALLRITSVAGQLQGLTAQLDDVKNNLGSLQQIVTENLASTNELRAAPEPASKDALQRLSQVANQLSCLLQEMNARQISAEQADVTWREQLCTQKDSDLAWREQLRAQKESDVAWREQLREQIGELRDTVAATEATILNATASSMSSIETATKFVDTRETPADIEVQSTNTAASAIVTKTVDELPVQEMLAPAPTPVDNGRENPPKPSPIQAIEFADNSSNFIEETIEEVSIMEEAASSSLPSWWTEDDRTQFKDDSVASVPLSSAWNISSQTAVSSNAIEDYSKVFATSSTENIDLPSSAWDVEVAYGNSQFEQAVPAVMDCELPLPLNSDSAVPEADNRVESIDDASLQSDESIELSSLLERFGIAHEPAANDVKDSSEYRKPIAKRDSKAFVGPLPQPRVSEFVQPPVQIHDLFVDNTEIVPVAQQPIAPSEPVSELLISTPPAESGEEESIEDYMKRLMARMRGGNIEEEARPSSPAPVLNVVPSPAPIADSMSSPKIAMPGAITERAANSTTGPFNPEEYLPKAFAPEKSRSLAAMRELANNSARSAIQVSARRRYGTAIALKLAIALIGLGVGVTLVMINGFNVNIGLIATIASFLVALIWGFDAFSTLKPLLYAAVENQDALAVSPQVEEIPQV